jgi:hypothetical protein
MILDVFLKWLKINSNFLFIFTLKMISLPIYKYFLLNTLVALVFNYKILKLALYNLG